PDGWVVVDTPHYQVQSQIGKDKAELLGGHLEDMRLLYRELVASRSRMPTFVVKVFESREAFLGYRNDELVDDSLSAWYDPIYKELVTFHTGILLGKREIPTAISVAPDTLHRLAHADVQRIYQLLDDATVAYTEDTARVLSHEGWHQYFHAYTVSWVPMPAWLDEGVAEYLYMASRAEGGGRRQYEAGAMNHARLRDVLRAYEDNRTKRTGLLLQYETTEYYREAEVLYAQGWSLVHFLMTHRSPKYRAVVPDLIRDFKDSKNFLESTTKAFRDFDLDELDREWLGWLLTQTPDDPLKDLAREYGRQIKPAHLQTGDEAVRDMYEWHLLNPNAPTRVPARPEEPGR
ncbi:MAG: DUF1570 domain-containing protein, partial [Planctomycetota bacterium]